MTIVEYVYAEGRGNNYDFSEHCNVTSYDNKMLKADCGPYHGDEQRTLNVSLCSPNWFNYREGSKPEGDWVVLSDQAMLLCGNRSSFLTTPLPPQAPDQLVGGNWLDQCAPLSWDGTELTASCLTATLPDNTIFW